jgi:hypothetical protein
MWESPRELWSRLKLGREEFLQRILTTLIVGGDPPPWNVARMPSEQGLRFLYLLDASAHGEAMNETALADPNAFVDEYLLPKVEESAANGWPDWAVLWPDRVWVIELKTEPGSHRADQLPYYLRLAAAAHPNSRVDLTYITGPLSKPGPVVGEGQRYSHLQWSQVVPLVEAVWGTDDRSEVRDYVDAVRSVVENLTHLRPSAQREAITGLTAEAAPVETLSASAISLPQEPGAAAQVADGASDLLILARATASDKRQRGVGAATPAELEGLRDSARSLIDALPVDDTTRFVLPWLWKAARTTGRALTAEGQEFGYELRFSRYKTMQVSPR